MCACLKVKSVHVAYMCACLKVKPVHVAYMCACLKVKPVHVAYMCACLKVKPVHVAYMYACLKVKSVHAAFCFLCLFSGIHNSVKKDSFTLVSFVLLCFSRLQRKFGFVRKGQSPHGGAIFCRTSKNSRKKSPGNTKLDEIY